MLTEYLLEKALDSAFSLSKRILSDAKSALVSEKGDVEEALRYHLSSVDNWCQEISFSDLREAKLTTKVYVELEFYLYPRRVRIESSENIGSVPLPRIFEPPRKHLIMLGQPGAGKTTSMKYVCTRLLHDAEFFPELFNFPILLRFRELNVPATQRGSRRPRTGDLPQSIILKTLIELFGLGFRLDESLLKREKEEEKSSLIERVLMTFLEELKPLVILEGFDELALVQERNIAINEIRTLARQLSNATLIVTSRTGEFPFNIENASHFEICPLKPWQVDQFSRRWLEDEEKAEHFQAEMRKSPFADVAIKPLTLAHLCAIYERIGRIPEKPKTVYRKIVNLLLEEWDEQRSVQRHSRYANFEVDRKFEFLCDLAYELTTGVGGTVFSADHLLEIYKRIHTNYDLVQGEAQQVVNELETHNGLFVQAGYRMFEFAHKSLQEYLAGEYVVRLPSLPAGRELLEKLPNELAIAVAISSNPSRYLTELALKSLCEEPLPPQFFETFVTRLLQEKPDFNAYDDVVISLAVLYSLYLDGGFSRKGLLQLNLFLFDDLVEQFEEFVGSVCKRNPKDVILKYYEEAGRHETVGGLAIVDLRKTRDTDTYQLPDHLYARPVFLGRAESNQTEEAKPEANKRLQRTAYRRR